MLGKGDIRRGNEPRLLTRLKGVCGAGKSLTQFDFHKRCETIALCD
jgi:hypothetical protein